MKQPPEGSSSSRALAKALIGVCACLALLAAVVQLPSLASQARASVELTLAAASVGSTADSSSGAALHGSTAWAGSNTPSATLAERLLQPGTSPLSIVSVPGLTPLLLVSHESQPPYADGDRGQLQILKDLRLAERCQQEPATTVVDVGGFLGDFGLTAAAVGCSVVIFEVQPKQVELIQASIRLNGFQDRVTLVNAAVSNTSGTSVTFAAAGGSTQPSSSGSITVQTRTLDEVFAGKRVFFLKVDVEGHELEVLQGARGLLSERRVDNAVFEFTAFFQDRADQRALLPLVQSFAPSALYAVDRQGTSVYGPLTQAHVEAFWADHNERHLQTDVFASFDAQHARLVSARPYAPGVNA